VAKFDRNLFQSVLDEISIDNLDRENTNDRKLDKMLRIAMNFGRNYIHDCRYICKSVEKMYFTEEGNEEPYSARKKVVDLINNPRKPYHANCLASATYMSYEMQKLGIPHNVLFIDNSYDSTSDYHGVVLYKYSDRYFICDVLSCHVMSQDMPFEIASRMLCYPFEDYSKFYETVMGGNFRSDNVTLYDSNIYPCGSPLSGVVLSEWPLDRVGLYSSDKWKEVFPKMRSAYYSKKFHS